MKGSAALAAATVDYLDELLGIRLPIRVRVWDGSEAGEADGVVVVLRSPAALRYMMWSPGELGVARAYVTGTLDVEGDLEDGLSRLLSALNGRRARLGPARAVRGVKLIAAMGCLGRPLPPPGSEARPRGRLHSRQRDAEVISHHYDLSNEFYSLLLDPSMAYSCGYWTDDRPGYHLSDAQKDKLDLICRKLTLRPGARLLDIGCGWGSLTVHAARSYGAQVTAVTVAAEQEAFIRRRLADEQVEHLVELRRCDYREVLSGPEGDFDAVTAIEMGEHVGESNYPAFLSGLRSKLKDQGRFLLQVMSRRGRHPGGGPFIERYIAPDMHMRPLAATVSLIEAAGFEVRDVHSMREHYARTIRSWTGHFERRWAEVVDLLGEERARVWRLYLVGGALAFETNRMGVDQILGVRTGASGASGMSATRAAWESGVDQRGLAAVAT